MVAGGASVCPHNGRGRVLLSSPSDTQKKAGPRGELTERGELGINGRAWPLARSVRPQSFQSHASEGAPRVT